MGRTVRLAVVFACGGVLSCAGGAIVGGYFGRVVR